MKFLKNDPGRHPFCKHISSNGDVINGDIKTLNVENSGKW